MTNPKITIKQCWRMVMYFTAHPTASQKCCHFSEYLGITHLVGCTVYEESLVCQVLVEHLERGRRLVHRDHVARLVDLHKGESPSVARLPASP